MTGKGSKKQKFPHFLYIAGVRIDCIKLADALSLVEKWVETNKQYQIVTPNPEHIVLAQKNEKFRRVLNGSDLAVPDGIGISAAVRLAKLKMQNEKSKTIVESSKFNDKYKLQRLSGVDFMVELCKLSAKKGWRVFLLGGAPGTAKQAAERINSHYSLLITHCLGSVDIQDETPIERSDIIRKINDFKPHLLFVAYGAPYQELWIAKNLPDLKVKIAMGVGGAFDYLSGRVSRAPKWVRKAGFEWLYRLFKQPWRLKRQLALLKFVWLIFKFQQKPVVYD